MTVEHRPVPVEGIDRTTRLTIYRCLTCRRKLHVEAHGKMLIYRHGKG